MEFSWYDEKACDTIDPWVLLSPEPATQTGGDWYRLFLTASLRGRAVHGANTSPTCEVLCKTTAAQIADQNFGIIEWDDSVKVPGILGRDISDQFYIHKPYRGNITASGSILAYESGLWEPSVRKRARSSALLAAGLVVHGKTSEEACAIVSRITGEPVDIQAVDNAVIPASHLKREMVLVSKASHRVFSKGTIQAGITWYDSNLVARIDAHNIAMDWGRVTALARYIAEANVQNCHAFRHYAKSFGIFYTVVRNSWAYVSEADYHLPSKIFDNVPKVDLAKLGVPSLIGTFVGHEQEVMRALTRGSKYLSVVPENEAFKAYIRLHKEARSRRGRRQKTQVPPTSQAKDVRVGEHTLTEKDLVELVTGGTIIRDAFLAAIASLRRADPSLDALLKEVATVDIDNTSDFSSVDKATGIIYNKQVWLLARVIAEGALKDKDDVEAGDRSYIIDKITSRLGDMKESIVGYKSHIETNLYLSTRQVVKLREDTIVNAAKSEEGVQHITFSQRTMASAHLRATAQALSSISSESDSRLRELRENVAPLFDRWYERVVSSNDEGVRTNLAYMAYIHALLNDITPSICYQKSSQYIEGTLPRRSYVYQGMMRTASDYGFVPPRLQRPAYTCADQMALELDMSKVIPYSVSNMVREVEKIADLVVGDLTIDHVWQPDPDFFDDLFTRYAKPLSPGYDDNSLKEEEAHYKLLQYMEIMNEQMKVDFLTGYEACLNTYPSEALGNQYAKANGYPNLRAAYDVLGTEACFSETNFFVVTARTKLALEASTLAGDDDGASTSNKRKYDAVL